MMGLLVQRNVFAPGQSTAGLPNEIAPTNTWMGIYGPGDTRIGFVNAVVEEHVREGMRGRFTSITSQLTMNLMSKPTELILAGTLWSSLDGSRQEIDFRVRSSVHTTRVEGTIREGESEFTIHTAGENYPLTFPVGSEILYLSDSTGVTNLNIPYLEIGQEIKVDAFDILTMSRGKATIRCIGTDRLEIGGEEVETKVLTTTVSGFTSTAWVTYDEEVVRAETPLGFSFQKLSEDEARKPVEAGDTQGLLAALSIQPTGKQPRRGVTRMRFRVSGVSKTLGIPSDHLQREIDENVYQIVSAKTPAENLEPDWSGIDAATHLRSDPLIQVDHPTIAEHARNVIGDARDDWGRALRIYEWVHTNIHKEIVPSFPSALEVLKTRKGDCNEHTVLFTAMARSVDIPTRIAIGVVWSGELDGFYYHAWPEVYVGSWIPMDPTLGQVVADATHVKLLTGDIEAWFHLVPYIGRLQIEVLEVE